MGVAGVAGADLGVAGRDDGRADGADAVDTDLAGARSGVAGMGNAGVAGANLGDAGRDDGRPVSADAVDADLAGARAGVAGAAGVGRYAGRTDAAGLVDGWVLAAMCRYLRGGCAGCLADMADGFQEDLFQGVLPVGHFADLEALARGEAP